MKTSPKLTASVIITTKNRKTELLRAVESALQQDSLQEVIVIDDGSNDGTSECIRRLATGQSMCARDATVAHTVSAPAIRAVRHETSKGYIVRRNEGARMAAGDVLISIDDDAIFSTPNIVSHILSEFSHPRIGAVAIPCIEPQLANKELQRAPSAERIWVTASFKGTAYAVRRDVFLKAGGFHEELVHQGEESDFCIRMLSFVSRETVGLETTNSERLGSNEREETCPISEIDARLRDRFPNVPGYFVRMGNSDPIIHNESPRRDHQRMDFYGRRNDILFHWRNTPLPYLVLGLPRVIVGGLYCAARTKRWRNMIRGMIAGTIAACTSSCREPKPVPVYRTFRQLRRKSCQI